MGVRMRVWLYVVVVVVGGALLPTTYATANDHNIGELDNLIQNDPASLCAYIRCQEPILKTECPDGSYYREGVAQFGCCGACVQFQPEGEPCTGSVDPRYGGGYGTFIPELSEEQTVELVASIAAQPQTGNVLQSMWCDYSLYCNENNTCQIDTKDEGCVYVQRQYDLAKSDGNYTSYRDDYRWRPDCTLDGKYAAKQCKGVGEEERCICVDPDGNRLFGDAFKIQTELYSTMNCACSRRVWERKAAGDLTVTLHCAANGNYETLQCEDGWCYCMDPNTTIPYDVRLPENSVKHLLCYNETLMGEQYLRRCGSQLAAHTELYEVMENRGVKGNPDPLVNCDLDGSFAGYQRDQVSAYCYDKYMKDQLSTSIDGTGCQCVRDKQFFAENNIAKSVLCSFNSGEYQDIQVLGETMAWCVDEDGVRSGPLVYQTYEESLNCDKATECQAGTNDSCDDVCEECPPDAYVLYNS